MRWPKTIRHREKWVQLNWNHLTERLGMLVFLSDTLISHLWIECSTQYKGAQAVTWSSNCVSVTLVRGRLRIRPSITKHSYPPEKLYHFYDYFGGKRNFLKSGSLQIVSSICHSSHPWEVQLISQKKQLQKMKMDIGNFLLREINLQCSEQNADWGQGFSPFDSIFF